MNPIVGAAIGSGSVLIGLTAGHLLHMHGHNLFTWLATRRRR